MIILSLKFKFERLTYFMLTIKKLLTNKFSFTQTRDLDVWRKNIVDGYEMDKLQLRQLEDLDEIEVF